MFNSDNLKKARETASDRKKNVLAAIGMEGICEPDRGGK